MSADLTLWLGDDLSAPSAPWGWRTAGGETGRAITDADKAQLGAMAAKTIRVIIAGQAVRIFPHDLPKMSAKERLSAARFAVEEQLAAPIDSLHIVLGDKDDNRIAVIAKDKMIAILGALSQADLNPSVIAVDFDCLPQDSAPLRLRDCVIVPAQSGAAGIDGLGYTLDVAWADDTLTALSERPVSAALEAVEIQAGHVQEAINLRSGEFVRRADFGGVTRLFSGDTAGMKLGRIAALLAACGLAWLGWEGMQARAGLKQAEHLSAQTKTLFTDITGKPAPRNPALEAARAMKSQPTSGGGGFLALTHAFNNAAKQIDGLSVETLQYDAARAQLNLRLNYPTFETTSEIEILAARAGGTFKAGGVREQSGGLVGDAVFTFGGGS